MLKHKAVEIIAAHRKDAISVATMQAAAPWHKAGQGKEFHVDASACMGSASSLGLGIAIGAPQKTVLVLDGDGSLLMQLGSLVTIGAQAPKNFFHIVFSNGHYESSGNQPVPGNGVFSFVALAKAAGYADAQEFSQAEDFDKALPQLLTRQGPILINLVIERDDAKPAWPGIPMAQMVAKLRADMGF